VRLTAIVPATDQPATLAGCEDAIAVASNPPEEVLVVTLRPGSGPSAARNAGADEASCDVLVFVDSDVAVHPDAFDRIRAAFTRDPELIAVFGSYDDSPDGALVSRFRNLLHHHVHQSSAGPVGTFWAGLGAIRRDAFLGAGGFDAGRFSTASMEDVELGMRLRDAGARVELDSGLLGKHLKSWTLPGMIHTDVVHRGIPWVALLLRRRRVPAELNLSWRHRLGAAGWIGALLALASGRPRAATAGVAVSAGANLPFYVLLARRVGLTGAVAGVGLHGVHYLSAAAAIPLGTAAHLRERRRAHLARSRAAATAVIRRRFRRNGGSGRNGVERAPEVERAERAVGAPRMGDPLELGRPR
jgi:hypothetical protein